MKNIEQLSAEVDPFWQSRLGRAFAQTIHRYKNVTPITPDNLGLFPESYALSFSALPDDEQLVAVTYYSGRSVWNSQTQGEFEVFCNAAGPINSTDTWKHLLNLQSRKRFVATSPMPVPKSIDRNNLVSYIEQRTSQYPVDYSIMLEPSEIRPDVLSTSLLAQALVLQNPDSSRFPTLNQLAAYAEDNQLTIEPQPLQEGLENILSQTHIKFLLDQGLLQRSDLHEYFANAASWIHGAALMHQKKLTGVGLALPFSRRNNAALDYPLESLPYLVEVTRRFYEDLPHAANPRKADIAPSALEYNRLGLEKFLRKRVGQIRSSESPFLLTSLPFAQVENDVIQQIQEQLVFLQVVITKLSKNPQLLVTRKSNGHSVPQNPSSHDFDQAIKESGGRKLYWGTRKFPFNDRSGIID